MSCIMPSAIKPIADKYDVSVKDIITATYLYEDKFKKEDYNENDIEYIDFLNDYFKISTTCDFDNISNFIKASNIWDKTDNGTINFGSNVNEKILLELSTAFGKENVINYTNANGENCIRIAQPTLNGYTKEMLDIKEKAQKDGTFMKAPNGKPTNLNERQWLQVRTKAFKDWFGDWENNARLTSIIESDDFEFVFENIPNAKLEIGSIVNAENNLNNLCLYTRNKAIAHLNKLGFKHVSAIGGLRAKSPVMDKTIIHHAAILNIGGKLYLYDMPQTEFITPTDKTFGDKNQYKEAIVTSNFKPRFIELTVDNLVNIYGDTEDHAKWLVEDQYDNGYKDNLSNASKVVDENGEPLVVYHHTDNPNLTKFSTEFDNYFAKSGGTKKAIFFDEEKTGTLDRKYDMPVFLNIKDLNEYNETKEQLHERGTSYREVVNQSAEKNDIDGGVHMKNFDDNKKENQSIWVIHNSNQVKSATDNIGSFSRENDDIRYSEQNIETNNINKNNNIIDITDYINDEFNINEQYFTEYEKRIEELAQDIEKQILDEATPRIKELFNNNTTSTIKDLLENIANSNSYYARLAANLLNKIGELGNANVYLRNASSLSQDGNIAGLANTDNFIEIAANCEGEFADATVLHEVLHLIVLNTNKSEEAREELSKIFNEIKSKILAKYGVKSLDEIKDENLKRRLYGLTNEDEFISEFYINREFKNEINTADQTFFQKIVSWLKKHAFKNRLSQEASNAIKNLLKEYDGTILNAENRKFVAQSESKKSAANIIGPETKINIFAGTNENADLSNFAERPLNFGKTSAYSLIEGTKVGAFESKYSIYDIGKVVYSTIENADANDSFVFEGISDLFSGLRFKTVEGAFQAAKLAFTHPKGKGAKENKYWKIKDYNFSNSNIFVLSEEGKQLLQKLQEASGAEAKSLGRQIIGLDTQTWDTNSSKIMKALIGRSFEDNPQALQRLLATGNATLTHTQDKGKWGIEFPKLLMEVRDELRNEINNNESTKTQSKTLVTKIISGGQTGVDTLGLEIGKELGIETGGTMTPGFAREKNVDSYTREQMEAFGLKEISPELQAGKNGKEFYLPRTEQNVINSDGTVYFATDADSAGKIATERFANKHNKPFLLNPTPKQLRQWIKDNNIKTLNVAGNRGSKLSNRDEIAKILREGLQEPVMTTGEKLQIMSDFCHKWFEFVETNKNGRTDNEGNIIPDHSYLVKDKNGKIISVVTKSASSFKVENGKIIYKPANIADQPFGIPSTTLGSTVDEITRDFFSGKILDADGNIKNDISYPNFSKKQLKDLINDLIKIKVWADDSEGITLISADFPMVAEYNGEYIGGTMDLIGYKETGEIFIFDMKNKLSYKTEDDFNTDGSHDDYRGQQNLYRAMFNNIAEKLGLNLQVSKDNMKILHFKCKYPIVMTWEKSADKQLTLEDPDSHERKRIQDYDGYESPKLVLDLSGSKQKEFTINYVDAVVKGIIDQQLNDEEMTTLFGTTNPEQVKTNIQNQAVEYEEVPVKIELSEIDKQLNNLYSSKIKNSDLSKLANNVMNTLSDIYDCIAQGDIETYSEILGISVIEEGSDEYKKFEELKSLNRDQLIERLPLPTILNFIREKFFRKYFDYLEEDIAEYDEESQYIIRTMQTCYNNFQGLLNLGYSRLILLEQRTISKGKVDENDIVNDGVQDTEQENKMSLEETSNKDLEHWMIEQMAVKASLSREWRRIIAKMPKLDENGEEILDTFGFIEFMDENTVINNLLNWFKGCTTIQQMEDILAKKVEYHPEYQIILDLIRNDQQLRSKFFQNFRKDFQTYSIVIVNYDESGKLVTSKKVINTCTATEFVLDTLGYKFATGFEFTNNLLHFDGNKRTVNVENLEKLQNKISNLFDVFKTKEDFKNDENVAKLENILKEFGITFPEKTIKQALDFESENGAIETGFNKNFVESILTELQEVLKTIKSINKVDTTGKKQYYNYSIFKENPDNGEISIRKNYKNILDKFEPYLENVVEASSYENGKMHYAFNPPSYTGKMMIKFADSINNPNMFDAFIEEEYGQYEWFKTDGVYNCPILHMMTEHVDLVNISDFAKNARTWFSHKTQLSYNKTPYTELSAATYMHSILTEFFIDPTTGNVRRAFYRVPMMSNKPTSEFISMPRFCGEDYKTDLTKYYRMVFRQELMRIRTVLERAVDSRVERIKNYDLTSKWIKNNEEIYEKLKNHKDLTWSDLQKMKDSGASFKFLSYINDLTNEGSDSKLKEYILKFINNNGDIKDTEIIEESFEAFDEVHKRNMKSIVDNQISYMDSIGIFEVSEREIGDKDSKVTVPYYKYFDFLDLPEDLSTKQKEEIAKRVGDDKADLEISKELLRQQKEIIDKALENFVWNDMLASINIIELTATDLAYYKNMEDFQKRFAQIHAPGLRLNTEAKVEIDGQWVEVSDKFSRTMYIKDDELNTGIEKDVAAAFDILIDKHPERKDTLIAMKSVVKAALKKVNVADAQALTSPTGMMKKLVMAGSWDDKMTKAYDRICSGNFTLSDLQVLIQPLKPFVYSQIKKNSYAQTMTNLKVGLQNKNSEYMILLADAILRGAKQNNKLVALFDFMESSAYTGRTIVRNGKVYKDNVFVRNANEDEYEGQIIEKGVYNKHGIDTIQFESAVKVGLEGVIDINDIYEEDEDKIRTKFVRHRTYDEIIKTLKDFSQSVAKPGEYDDRYVHTFSYEDYAVQQEVPAHLQGHRQLLGSQERILAISDIPFNTSIYFRQYDGVELKTAEDVITRYQKLIAENIEESFNELSKELGLQEKDITERNKILSELLKEEIRKDARYGADMLVACTLNSGGTFNIPLSDPIQATRIQQLLHSIIKSRINKQKIAGGPVVQTSCWGVDSKYKIRFKNEEGELLKTFNEYGKSEEEYAKYLKDNNASLASFDCAMPVPTKELERDLIELAKTIDKAKGVKYNGRLATPKEAVAVGLITEEQLQAIGYRIPTEDKYSIYPMRIVEWVPRSAGEVIILPEEITKLTGSDFDIDKTYIILKEFERKEFNREYGFKNFNSIFNDLVKKIQKSINGPIVDNERRAFYGIEPERRNLTKGEAEKLLIDYIDTYDINHNSNSYKNLVKRSIINSIIGSETLYKKKIEGREGRNNEIFDIQWTMLTSQDMIDKMFNPGSFDPQKKIAFIIQCVKNENNKKSIDELKAMDLDSLEKYLKSITTKDNNITYISTQVQFHQQNMVAGKLIGIFANNNVSHAFAQMQDIRMNFDTELNLSFCEVPFGQSMKLDDIYALDKTSYISKNIAGFLAASVDAVKDPILNHLNLNTFTTNTAMLLARLGFSVDQISLFLSQPILIEFSKRMANKNNEGYASASDVLEQMMYEIDENWRENLKNHIKGVDLKEDTLFNNLKLNNSSYNFEILRMFYNLLPYTQALSDLTFITKFNSMSNAAGPTIADDIIMNDKVERFNKLFEDKENSIFNKETQNILSEKNSPILHAFHKYTVSANGAVEKVFSPYFVQYTKNFKDILKNWKETTKAPLDEKTINQLALDYLLFKLTTDRKGKQFFKSDAKMRNYYINKFPEEYWKTINENPELQENALIKIITSKIKNKKCPVDTLQASTGGFAADTQEQIKNAWAELLASNNKDYRMLGKKLFYYCLMRNGFGFSPKTFIHLASVDVKLEMGYTNLIQKVTFNDDLINVDTFIEQFKRNRSNNYRAVPKFKSKMYTGTDVMHKGSSELILTQPENGNLNEFLTNDKKPIGIIKVDNQLFKYVKSENDGKVLRYIAVGQLGNPNNFLEYNAEDSDIKTVIDNTSLTDSLEMPSESEFEEMFNEQPSSTQSQSDTMDNDVPTQQNVAAAVQKANQLSGGNSGSILKNPNVNTDPIKDNPQIIDETKKIEEEFCAFLNTIK